MTPPNNIRLYTSQAAYESAMAFYDKCLAMLTVPYQTEYIPTQYGVTHVLKAGMPEKPPLVLWHGMNINLTMWVDMINRFAPDFYVIAADSPGHSGRSAPERMSRKTMEYGMWAAEVIRRLSLPQAYHIGISGGGWQILKLANIAPESIRAAVLISTAGFLPVSLSLIIRMLPHLLFNRAQNSAQKFLQIMSPPGHQPSEIDIETFSQLFNFKSERTIPVLSDAEIAALTAPTLLLMGQYEVTYSPQKVIKRAQRTLPNLRDVQLVEGVGHGMTGERPEYIANLITQWFKKLERE